jgi:hypothetical protein
MSAAQCIANSGAMDGVARIVKNNAGGGIIKITIQQRSYDGGTQCGECLRCDVDLVRALAKC